MNNGAVNLSGSWDTLWNAITSGAGPQFTAILSVLGVGIVVVSLLGFLFGRLRKKTDNNGKLLIALAVGGVLAAPGVVFPLVLQLADLVINAIISLYNATRK